MKIFKNYFTLLLLLCGITAFVACEEEDEQEPTSTTSTNSGSGSNNSGNGGSSSTRLNSFVTLGGEFTFNDSLTTSGTIATRTDNVVWDQLDLEFGNSSSDYTIIFRMNPANDITVDVNDPPNVGTYDGSQNGFGLTVFASNNPSKIYTAQNINVTIDESTNDIITGTIISDSLLEFGGTKIVTADIKFRTTWRSVFF